MTKDEAWLIVRMAHAIGEEGIWHHTEMTGPVSRGTDNAILTEATQLAWSLMPGYMREDLGPVPRTT